MASSEFTYKLTDEDIKNLIRLRTTNSLLFTRKRNAAKAAWSAIIRELGLDDKVTVEQIAKKWENLKLKYKEIKYPPPGMEAVTRSTQWRWFQLLDEALKDEFNLDESFHSMTSSVSDDNCGPQASKRICQVKVGSDVLELLVDDDSITRISDSGPAILSQERLLGEEKPTMLSGLDIERTRLAQERQLLEKELEELDRERLVLEREKDLADREKLALQRDRAQLEKDRAAVDRDRASLEQDRARLEKDRAALERDKAALVRDRETLKSENQGKNSTECSLDTPHEKNREKLILLFERLIEKF
ncbi:uncharacterized protein zgc:171459 [Silurus meridionalis]|uniref:Myb/SANT-like DNA-binding domain-containing protein n=1 Tax=Silurus meridionalis TaxID=175797 RepID=A0A8T0BKF3_SILME|nr:uncharacterized protein zgc:171459 [Silurus meridionalis]KAF7707589.1 hypothetical protein HF521_018807 [Silurus meridionalis]